VEWSMMNRNVRIFTRRELFDLVWSRPMRKVAEELGISDRGLARICIRHRVPSPSRGYWARVTVGQKIKPPLYREVSDPSMDRIEVTATLSNLPEETVEIIRKAKADRVGRGQINCADLAVPPPPVKKLNRIVASTARELRKARPNQHGGVSATGVGTCGVVVHVDNAERVIAFLHALATALEAAGLQLQPDGARMKIAVGPDEVAFTLIERTRREKHIPTEDERGLHERHQAKRQRAADRQNWDLYMSLH
jgi:hypothetical protein